LLILKTIRCRSRGNAETRSRALTRSHSPSPIPYDYHQLGMIVQERGQYDRAEARYRQALEIFERLGHPPLLVDTLAQMGLLRRDQARPGEAVAWLGRAMFIAANYQMRVTGQILVNLARLMGAMGEETFTAAWQEAFPDQAPPWDALRRVLEDLEGED
jgi:tetratricopeptide (TPR) repeat protein